MRAGSTVGLRGGKASVGRCERGRGGHREGQQELGIQIFGEASPGQAVGLHLGAGPCLRGPAEPH